MLLCLVSSLVTVVRLTDRLTKNWDLVINKKINLQSFVLDMM